MAPLHAIGIVRKAKIKLIMIGEEQGQSCFAEITINKFEECNLSLT